MARDPGSDPLVQELRAQITANDAEIVAAVNRRLRLVQQLKTVKSERGYDFVDRGREESLLAELEETNRGPLSAEALRELHALLLDLTKRELS